MAETVQSFPRPLAAALEHASGLLASRPALAARRAQEILRQAPKNPGALLVLGLARRRLDDPAGAREVLEPLARAQPDAPHLHFELGLALSALGEPAPAIVALERAVALKPNLARARRALGSALAMLGDHAGALGVFEVLLADYPGQAASWLVYGHVLRAVGRLEESVAAYDRCIALAPACGEAYWSLANLKTVPFSGDRETAMRALLERPDLPAGDRCHLHFALGKAREDASDHAVSFAHYAQGAKLRRQELPYDADATSAQARRSRSLFTRRFFAERSGTGSLSDAPIFIVGLPRSGSTLIEQILASHPAVEGLMELPQMVAIARTLARRDRRAGAFDYSQAVADLGADDLAALGNGYLEGVRPYRRLARPFFTDKAPNNFHHIGLIHLILPHAKIIDARRDSMAAGFSAFKQHFASGHAFSYDLADIGRHHRDYVELMAHFDDVLPGRIHRVRYEALVEDTEGEIRRLLGHCGLPFDAACLNFHRNDRPVRSASSEQVRRPIFREGLDHWRRYEPWLGPLKDVLGGQSLSIPAEAHGAGGANLNSSPAM